MSTQYIAEKKDIFEAVDKLQMQLYAIQEDCLEKIRAIPVLADLEERKDDLVEKLSSRYLFSIETPESASVVIGTARAGHFSWRTDNGFRDLYSLEQWLQAHPEFSIFDEYGESVTWDEFREIVAWCGT